LNALRNIDLNLLVVFEAIYSSGNITSAARKLGVSQPTISNSLARLRDSIGDPLFVREGRGIKPTARAVQLIESVRQALYLIEGGIARAESFDPSVDKRHFRIAMLDLIEPIIMPALMRDVQASGNISFEIIPAADGKMLKQKLNDGSIELIVADYQPHINDTACEPLGPVEAVMIARKGHPKIDGEITKEMFSALGHVAIYSDVWGRARMVEVLERLNLRRNIVYTVTRFWSFPNIVATTDLVAIVPAKFAKAMEEFYPLQTLPLPFSVPDEQTFYMTWKSGNTDKPHHRWLRQSMAAIYSGSTIA
jgi:DNA-binding transcriptional LysR family regulator